ncbi:tyrosine-type recombinase/integrase [Aquipseudomonas alcaligenes]|uniref:tyrosine-type recombinase/integrase n=1 Tax=Aquipseudomonas alcaligenes TaxID=43263 RepID=UPI00364D7778
MEVKFTPSRQRIRSDRQVRVIGQRCLDFLISIGKLCADTQYVSESGRIPISLKEAVSTNGKRRHKRTFVLREHRSFPQATPLHTRLPISNDSIALIKSAATHTSNSSFLKLRRLVMLRVFEATGARRVEVSQIRVPDILRALNDGTYKVEFNSAKQGGEASSKRLIPLTRTDLKFIQSYIDIQRSAVIKRTCGKSKDSGFLFISETTGAPLRPNTLTQEMSQLRIAAKLTNQACLHMFRHRFITKLFVYHLEKFHSNNECTFVALNKHIETIKAMVKELTGHKDPDSLNFYINLAFEEASFFKSSQEAFLQSNSIDAFHADVKYLREQMKSGLCTKEATEQLLRIFQDYKENFSG